MFPFWLISLVFVDIYLIRTGMSTILGWHMGWWVWDTVLYDVCHKVVPCCCERIYMRSELCLHHRNCFCFGPASRIQTAKNGTQPIVNGCLQQCIWHFFVAISGNVFEPMTRVYVPVLDIYICDVFWRILKNGSTCFVGYEIRAIASLPRNWDWKPLETKNNVPWDSALQ